MNMFQGILGLGAFIALAWLLSENRRAISWRIVVVGLVSQFVFAALVTNIEFVRDGLRVLSDGVAAVSAATTEGSMFVFGYLGGGPSPFEVVEGRSTFILSLNSFPLILVIGALSALLWHWRILIYMVRGAAIVMQRSFGVGGAVGVSSAANLFMGMSEAPLLVRPYLPTLTRSELLVMMAGGMGTIAGSMMVLYGSILEPYVPNAFGHLLAASVINIPAAILLAKIMVPGDPVASDQVAAIELKSEYASSLDAISTGTIVSIKLLAYVIALLLVFTALISLLDVILGNLPDVQGSAMSLARIFGWLFAPVAWLLGIPWSEATAAGAILGTKIAITEMMAYLNMMALPEGTLSSRSTLIMTYALSSFANLPSLAILIGALNAMAPERHKETVSLGIRSLIAGACASAMSACVIGILS